ncbi:hypothetical protein PRIPAC_90944 [Pristionchus pacificus]|uniref:Uncharacterized protein n=1 Tax=Pristionchus pacificus TaxID=54126 RepID=A0A2A6B3S8_PRIPA|nr:hypothetical protein PRIPAC_90944 [Pristionchus pacificus]|eukprot:PDM60536.1 hypothetical protein PRIPAC_53514 [Pristionchus pacificus]
MPTRSVVDVDDVAPDSSVVHFDPNDPKYLACCCCHAQSSAEIFNNLWKCVFIAKLSVDIPWAWVVRGGIGKRSSEPKMCQNRRAVASVVAFEAQPLIDTQPLSKQIKDHQLTLGLLCGVLFLGRGQVGDLLQKSAFFQRAGNSSAGECVPGKSGYRNTWRSLAAAAGGSSFLSAEMATGRLRFVVRLRPAQLRLGHGHRVPLRAGGRLQKPGFRSRFFCRVFSLGVSIGGSGCWVASGMSEALPEQNQDLIFDLQTENSVESRQLARAVPLLISTGTSPLPAPVAGTGCGSSSTLDDSSSAAVAAAV